MLPRRDTPSSTTVSLPHPTLHVLLERSRARLTSVSSHLPWIGWGRRAEGFRMGPDAGGGEHVHRAPQERAHQADSLPDPGRPRRGRHPRQPALPQRSWFALSSNSIPLKFVLNIEFFLDILSVPLRFLIYGLILQHDLMLPVKTDSSFWTIGMSQFSTTRSSWSLHCPSCESCGIPCPGLWSKIRKYGANFLPHFWSCKVSFLVD